MNKKCTIPVFNFFVVKMLAVGISLFMAFTVSSQLAGIPDTPWEQVHFDKKGGMLFSVAWGMDKYVATGGKGLILVSSDGKNWKSAQSGTEELLNGVTVGKDLFVAVGTSGVILTSPDGMTWTKRELGTERNLQSVIFGNNRFVAVGDGCTILTSDDGITWTVRATGDHMAVLFACAYGNGRFVAVGQGGLGGWATTTGFVMVSNDDGVSWIKQTSGARSGFLGVAFGNDTFVAVGNTAGSYSSKDGINWTEGSHEKSEKRHVSRCKGLGDVIFTDSYFCAVGASSIILTSTDGLHWGEKNDISRKKKDFVPHLFGIACGRNGLVAVGGGDPSLSSSAILYLSLPK